ncbi:MAG TPA: DUF4375 domain-containing protein [Acidobacteriaceae bacterium]
MSEDELLERASDTVYQEMERVGGDPLKLPLVMQPIAILYTVQAMVDNGGFRYLFEGDFPFSPPYSAFAAAYREIGASDIADLLERAVALFPFENPHLNSEGRNNYMDSLQESDPLFLLGDMVCGDERVWKLMEEYVKNHPEAFPNQNIQ